MVAATGELPDGSRMIVSVRGRSVGIFNVGGRYFAVRNRCPHQGAELCLGLVSAAIESDGPGDVRFDDSRPMLQCPWHRWEFDLATGQSYFAPHSTRVRSYSVSIAGLGDGPDPLATGTTDSPHLDAQPPLRQVSGRLVPGPYAAETIPVTVEDGYVVLHMS